ncbi:unnamed protein product [Peniophora sp. CBMAI 1063]|nr:unnamed protein product [Peniophora sp. CBMAI 1063]
MKPEHVDDSRPTSASPRQSGMPQDVHEDMDTSPEAVQTDTVRDLKPSSAQAVLAANAVTDVVDNNPLTADEMRAEAIRWMEESRSAMWAQIMALSRRPSNTLEAINPKTRCPAPAQEPEATEASSVVDCSDHGTMPDLV